MSFAFAFSGADIEDDGSHLQGQDSAAIGKTSEPTAAPGAFPVAGKPLLPPTHYKLSDMLAELPPKLAFSMVSGGGRDDDTLVSLPRRELWDVKVQVMAEQDVDQEMEPGLAGNHDVKTGIYEGGFKCWESSLDLAQELRRLNVAGKWLLKGSQAADATALRIVELGCGTALPSITVFYDVISNQTLRGKMPLCITVADYNYAVLKLVTLPNFILAWALVVSHEDTTVKDALDTENGTLDVTAVVPAFCAFLDAQRISLSFVSGGWCPEFVDLLYASPAMLGRAASASVTVVLGAETIYSLYALDSFCCTVEAIFARQAAQHQQGQPHANETLAVVAAKRHYFGLGASLEDFCERARAAGLIVTSLWSETRGVNRAVVKCHPPDMMAGRKEVVSEN